MRRMMAICRKELQMYFFSPVAYAAFAFYFMITGYFFSIQFLQSQIVDVSGIFGNVMMVFLFIIPLLTMRLIADEFRHGTDEMLLTSPASVGEIIMGKFFAALSIQLLLVVLSLIYPLILSRFGPIDHPIMWLSYLSVFLLGAAMMSVGLFASTFTSHQMIAGISGFALILLFWLIDDAGNILNGKWKDYLKDFSMLQRTSQLNKGVFDLTDVLFFVLFIVLFIFLSMQSLERKRWR
ncbi:MAG: ABC transporter permease [Paenibacillus sp. RIFOXYA1_FULL_44_5]|nr:MAG: ABC transporter permease [Paenibacillus sp. RIFOXYA1_FULL_44_5]